MTTGDGIFGLAICYLLANILTLFFSYFTNKKHTSINEERLQKIEKLMHDNGLDI